MEYIYLFFILILCATAGVGSVLLAMWFLNKTHLSGITAGIIAILYGSFIVTLAIYIQNTIINAIKH
jgi:hypothetical protein